MFWIPGTIFPKIVWGLSIKSQEIRSQKIKSGGKYIRRKKKPKKKVLNLVKVRSSLRRFHVFIKNTFLRICTLDIAIRVFLISIAPFCMV